MEDNLAIKCDNISKKFSKTLSKSMLYGITDIARNTLGISSNSHKLRPSEFWAVDDVSFEVKKGETMGLIGPNGTGKTTILKMLNGIYWPDKGKISIKGKVGALIAVGAGFHPMLTGRENVYLNGAILGMDKKTIDGKFEEIIDFADIWDFIDTPVKYYSSGMYVRLGFSVAAFSDPEVLLVDEILSVGDYAFRMKSMQKMIDIITQEDTSIVFVSHLMINIRELCDKVLLLQNGKKLLESDAEEAISVYEKILLANQNELESPSAVYKKYSHLGRQIFFTGDEEVSISEPKIVSIDDKCKDIYSSTEGIKIRFSYHLKKKYQSPFLFIRLIRSDGLNVWYQTFRDHKLKVGGETEVEILIDDLQIVPGTYILSVRMANHFKGIGCAPPIEFKVQNTKEALDLYGIRKNATFYPRTTISNTRR